MPSQPKPIMKVVQLLWDSIATESRSRAVDFRATNHNPEPLIPEPQIQNCEIQKETKITFIDGFVGGGRTSGVDGICLTSSVVHMVNGLAGLLGSLEKSSGDALWLFQELEETATLRSLKQEVGQKKEVHCSRERSRAAWKAIEEYLMPFVDEEQYQLPPKCRLNPENDVFRDQEQHKIHAETNEWSCGYCKKSFRAEKFLDQHFDNRHYNLLNDSQGRCLADLCGALHCDFVTDSKKTKSKCNPAAAARNKHLCESLADSCFPLNKGQLASRLHEFFLRQFCDAHTCTGGKKPFSRGGKKESSIFYLAVCILVVMLLPLFYTVVYLHQREMKKGVQVLRRISKPGLKAKPS